jgi:hypothetical protein
VGKPAAVLEMDGELTREALRNTIPSGPRFVLIRPQTWHASTAVPRRTIASPHHTRHHRRYRQPWLEPWSGSPTAMGARPSEGRHPKSAPGGLPSHGGRIHGLAAGPLLEGAGTNHRQAVQSGAASP